MYHDILLQKWAEDMRKWRLAVICSVPMLSFQTMARNGVCVWTWYVKENSSSVFWKCKQPKQHEVRLGAWDKRLPLYFWGSCKLSARSMSCKWGVFEKLGHLRRLHEIPHGRGLVPCGLTYFNRKATSYAFSATIPMIIMQAQRAARIFHQIAGDLARSVGKAGARSVPGVRGAVPSVASVRILRQNGTSIELWIMRT